MHLIALKSDKRLLRNVKKQQKKRNARIRYLFEQPGTRLQYRYSQ